jgi:hypothetical protein
MGIEHEATLGTRIADPGAAYDAAVAEYESARAAVLADLRRAEFEAELAKHEADYTFKHKVMALTPADRNVLACCGLFILGLLLAAAGFVYMGMGHPLSALLTWGLSGLSLYRAVRRGNRTYQD